ncbi:MAG: hypothetical protein ACKO8N_11330 [Rubrivivax sp.]
MKPTIEKPDELLERSKRRQPFELKPFAGDGLTPEFQSAGWERIRDEIYRERG